MKPSFCIYIVSVSQMTQFKPDKDLISAYIEKKKPYFDPKILAMIRTPVTFFKVHATT